MKDSKEGNADSSNASEKLHLENLLKLRDVPNQELAKCLSSREFQPYGRGIHCEIPEKILRVVLDSAWFSY